MISHFASIREIDNENFDQLDHGYGGLQNFHSPDDFKLVNDPTDLCDKGSYEDFVMGSSSKNASRDYQISFQQGFLKEHQKAFEKQAEKFMEASFKFYQNRNVAKESFKIFGTMPSLGLWQAQDSYSNDQEEEPILKKLKSDEKLSDFLQYLQKVLPQEIFQEYVKIAHLGYEFFEKKRDNPLDPQEIQEQAEMLAEEKAEQLYQSLSYLNFKMADEESLRNKSQLKIVFRQHIESFLGTILLVLFGYFENPYSDVGIGKRYRDDSFDDLFEQDGLSFLNSFVGKVSKKSH